MFFFSGFSGYAQVASEKETFDDAEYFIAQEDYNEALSSYLKLYKRGYKENANINYRIGICYLNSSSEKDKAIPYLEKAVKKVSEKYSEGSIKEVNAPFDAYLFLGNAYRINMQLDKSVETYKKYLTIAQKRNDKEDEINKSWALTEIEACKRAKTAMAKPGHLKITPLGKPVNTNTANYNPVITPDENYLVFVTHQRFYDAVMVSKKVNGVWENPENITPEIQSDGDQFPCFISRDGKTLLLNKQNNFNSDIYISHFEGNKWVPSKPLNKFINTKYWESSASITDDGKKLYFTSNRPLGHGGNDIYVSELTNINDWDEPSNLGKIINTQFNEESPFISGDGKTLYFASQGHENIGGYDIFYATLDDKGKWSKPINMGYPVNSTDDDLSFVPVQDGVFAYQSRIIASGEGDLDIVRLEIFSDKHPFIYGIKGNLSVLFKDEKPETFLAEIIDPISGNKLDSVRPLPEGDFNFAQKAGTYQVNFKSANFTATSKNFTIPADYEPDNYLLTSELLGVSVKYDAYQVLKPNETVTEAVKSISEKQVAGQIKKEIKTVAKPSTNSPVVLHNILFTFDESKLTKIAEKDIALLAGTMNDNPSLVIEISGYTDALGSDKYNQRLAEKRARIVKDKLIEAGIASIRIKTKGKGKQDYIALNTNFNGTDNPEGRSYNRRVEFRIVACDNKNVSVEPVKVPDNLKRK
jgi:outer membrane protein OmpA-like peptidoglycan-associated protein/tetratricopeptide (TPR) repeat protein